MLDFLVLALKYSVSRDEERVHPAFTTIQLTIPGLVIFHKREKTKVEGSLKFF